MLDLEIKTTPSTIVNWLEQYTLDETLIMLDLEIKTTPSTIVNWLEQYTLDETLWSYDGEG